MTKRVFSPYTILLLALICDLTTRPAYAYLDPGAGSYAIQVIIAGIASGLFAMRFFFARIVNVFKRRSPAAEQPTTPTNE